MQRTLIKTLDLNDFLSRSAGRRRDFILSLTQELQDKGFIFLKNHGIPQASLARGKHIANTFFDLPSEQRLKYEWKHQKHERAYTPLSQETGEFANIADFKHFWQVKATRNPIVKEVNFKPVYQLFNEFRICGSIIGRAIARSLELPENYFDLIEGDSVMRIIDYPRHINPYKSDRAAFRNATRGGNIVGMCASEHTDINLFTLLEAKEPGLQLKYKGKWIPVTIDDPNLIVVNVGDMLEHLTNGLYVSGLHKVVCRRNKRRQSMVFFYHPRRDSSILPLKNCGEPNLEKYPYKTARQFFRHPIQQIQRAL